MIADPILHKNRCSPDSKDGLCVDPLGSYPYRNDASSSNLEITHD